MTEKDNDKKINFKEKKSIFKKFVDPYLPEKTKKELWMVLDAIKEHEIKFNIKLKELNDTILPWPEILMWGIPERPPKEIKPIEIQCVVDINNKFVQILKNNGFDDEAEKLETKGRELEKVMKEHK